MQYMYAIGILHKIEANALYETRLRLAANVALLAARRGFLTKSLGKITAQTGAAGLISVSLRIE
jgi:hypothetical protein